ncbi:MAG: hypothetical protein AB1798_01240 [Spirochaetota bacterium]
MSQIILPDHSIDLLLQNRLAVSVDFWFCILKIFFFSMTVQVKGGIYADKYRWARVEAVRSHYPGNRYSAQGSSGQGITGGYGGIPALRAGGRVYLLGNSIHRGRSGSGHRGILRPRFRAIFSQMDRLHAYLGCSAS